MLEIEVKARVSDAAAMRQAILQSGGRLERDRTPEENTLFDLRSKALTKKGCALRVRRAGRKVFLTFKGPAQKSRRFKVREEHETEVRDEKQLRRILRALGYVCVFRYQKSRTTFRRGRVRIMLDETAAGGFLEFEGERSDIIKCARCLGFSSGDLIKQDYIQILKAQEKRA
ncbi:MAG: class IV adenylate cyclase [Candidatus Aminicenantes bacterium]|nr:class IV adenylate cyclase [Candidatus Aminicenantes bacterium]